MTSDKKLRKAERKAKERLCQQRQVAYNREVYNRLCEIVQLIYNNSDSDILDLPKPISEKVSNSVLSVDHTRALIRDAINVLRSGVNACMFEREASAREYSELARRISDMGKDYYGLQ